MQSLVEIKNLIEAKQSLKADKFDLVNEDKRNLFIDEAVKVLKMMDDQLPKWNDNTKNVESLKQIQGGFEALKISAYKVGANSVGKVASVTKDLLDHVLDNTVKTSDDLISFINDVKYKIPYLVNDFANADQPNTDIAELILKATNLKTNRHITNGFSKSDKKNQAQTEQSETQKITDNSKETAETKSKESTTQTKKEKTVNSKETNNTQTVQTSESNTSKPKEADATESNKSDDVSSKTDNQTDTSDSENTKSEDNTDEGEQPTSKETLTDVKESNDIKENSESTELTQDEKNHKKNSDTNKQDTDSDVSKQSTDNSDEDKQSTDDSDEDTQSTDDSDEDKQSIDDSDKDEVVSNKLNTPKTSTGSVDNPDYKKSLSSVTLESSSQFYQPNQGKSLIWIAAAVILFTLLLGVYIVGL